MCLSTLTSVDSVDGVELLHLYAYLTCLCCIFNSNHMGWDLHLTLWYEIIINTFMGYFTGLLALIAIAEVIIRNFGRTLGKFVHNQ